MWGIHFHFQGTPAPTPSGLCWRALAVAPVSPPTDQASPEPCRGALVRTISGRLRRWLSAVLAACLLLFAASPAWASSDPREQGAGTHFLVGLGAGVLTLLYTPVKIIYAATSIPIGGLVYTWSIGDMEMARRVMLSGTQGSYVVTPEHLRGERRFTFVGSAEGGPSDDASGATSRTAAR
jgi:hypothetical protein